MDTSTAVINVIVALVVCVVLFLILRALVLWYWRINEIVDELKRLNKNVALLVPQETAEEREARFAAWLATQNRRAADLSAEKRDELRKEFDWKRKLGEI